MILINYKYPKKIDENGFETTDYEAVPISDSKFKKKYE